MFNIKYSLFFLLIICLASHVALASIVTRQTTLEIETKARQLGKIWNGDEIRRSVSLFAQASENWQKLGELEKSSFCLRQSAQLSLLISDHQNALKSLMKALKIDKKIKNIDGQVISYSLLARLELQKGNIDQVQPNIDLAIKLSESATDQAKGFCYLINGEIELVKANLTLAGEFFAKALSFTKSLDDPDLNASILLNFGIYDAIKGNKENGSEKIREALKIWKKLDNKRGITLSYSGFAFIYAITDEKQKALNNFKLAESMFPEDVDYLEKAKMYSTMTKLYVDFGQIDLAENSLQNALENHINAKFEFGQLAILPHLAQFRYLQGNKESSKKLYESAIRLSKKLNNDFYLFLIKEHLGNMKFSEGKFNLAIAQYKEALKITNKTGVEVPKIQNSLGRVYESKGEFDIARQYFEDALIVNRRTKDFNEVSENLYNLARLSDRNGNTKKALAEVEESMLITESFYNDVGNHFLRESFLSDSFDRYELYINLLMKMHRLYPDQKYDRRAFLMSEKARSRSMRENLHFAGVDLAVDANPKVVEKEKQLLRMLSLKKEELTKTLIYRSSSQEVDKLNLEITELDNKLQSTKAILRADSPIYSALKNYNDFDISAFQQDILDDDTLLLEFFFGKEKSFVWLIGKNEFQVFDLPGCRSLESKIEELLGLINVKKAVSQDNIQSFQKALVENEAQYANKSQVLSQLLFGQFAGKLSGKRLLIVPDGKLQYFPISALPVPNDPNNQPFVLTNEIVLEPSASMLYLMQSKHKSDIPPLKNFLVYTDPVFAANDTRIPKEKYQVSNYKKNTDDTSLITYPKSLSALNRLERLEASGQEASNIFQYFDSKFSKMISGFEANRKNFLSDKMSDYKVIHLATHGLFNDKNPELSGIVLSQFNKDGKKQNGFIWLQDIYSLKLSADLVVLSACDTGIGEDIKGEGLMSLTNAFLQVGAKSVVSSHWKVEDQATQILMKDFYQILANENVTPSVALNKAKIRLYQNPNYRFPYYWASFTIHGDFKNNPNLPSKFNYSVYLMIICSVIVLFGIVRFIKYL